MNLFDSNLQLPKGSRILDVGCGIGGSSRILSNDYEFDVVGISISQEQIKRANELTTNNTFCRFEVMNALDLNISNKKDFEKVTDELSPLCNQIVNFGCYLGSEVN